MDFFQAARDARTRRRGATLILAALAAVWTMAIAAPAQAHEPWVAKAWGLNASGQLGDGTTAGPESCGGVACSTTPVEVSGLSGVVAVAGGPAIFSHFSLALLEGGMVRAWGANGSGQLGDGTSESSDVPVAVQGLSGVVAISAGEEHGLALLSDGTVMAWGKNATGQLGDGTTETRDVPVAVCAGGTPSPCPAGPFLGEVSAIAAGGKHSLALLKNGTVMAWGENASGQLGDGSETNKIVPVAVSGLTGVAAISAGEFQSLALLQDGTVKAWGSNKAGQLGDGTSVGPEACGISGSCSKTPVAVCAGVTPGPCPVGLFLGEVSAISSGGQNSLGLLKTGTVMAWGNNEKGQLGDATSTGPELCGTMTACSATPVAVSGLTGVVAISAGGQHSLALHSDGTLQAWGANGSGQLGDGTSEGPEPCGPGACSTKPLQVSHVVAVKGISGGGQHSLAFGPPPPAIAAISPNEPRKKGSTTVTITGAEFEEATTVKFGSANATQVAVSENGTKITAVAPAGKGIVDVTVETPAGTSLTSQADKFYYEPPTIKKLSPRKGLELGGTSVTITGMNFTGATTVKFGSIEATSFNVNSATSITAVSPAQPKGRVDVTVATPNGTSAISGKDRFRYR